MKFKPGQVIERFKVDGKEVVFRTPKRSDLDGCLKHINSLVKEKAYLVSQKRVTMEDERKWLKKVMGEVNGSSVVHVFVIIDGRYAGNARVEKGRPEATDHVANIGIGLSSHRGLGIGTRLMETLERIARKHFRSRILKLTVYEENTPARRLYRKMGFRETGRIPKGCDYYGKYMDEIIMVKELK